MPPWKLFLFAGSILSFIQAWVNSHCTLGEPWIASLSHKNLGKWSIYFLVVVGCDDFCGKSHGLLFCGFEGKWFSSTCGNRSSNINHPRQTPVFWRDWVYVLLKLLTFLSDINSYKCPDMSPSCDWLAFADFGGTVHTNTQQLFQKKTPPPKLSLTYQSGTVTTHTPNPKKLPKKLSGSKKKSQNRVAARMVRTSSIMVFAVSWAPLLDRSHHFFSGRKWVFWVHTTNELVFFCLP